MIRAIGIDVHKDSYSISAFDPHTTNFSAETTVAADSKSVITYLKRLKKEIAAPVTIEIGYEAGPTGFGLKRDLEKSRIHMSRNGANKHLSSCCWCKGKD